MGDSGRAGSDTEGGGGGRRPAAQEDDDDDDGLQPFCITTPPIYRPFLWMIDWGRGVLFGLQTPLVG